MEKNKLYLILLGSKKKIEHPEDAESYASVIIGNVSELDETMKKVYGKELINKIIKELKNKKEKKCLKEITQKKEQSDKRN